MYTPPVDPLALDSRPLLPALLLFGVAALLIGVASLPVGAFVVPVYLGGWVLFAVPAFFLVRALI